MFCSLAIWSALKAISGPLLTSASLDAFQDSLAKFKL